MREKRAREREDTSRPPRTATRPPKSEKRLSKRPQALGCILGALGCFLGASGCLLNALGCLLGALGRLLGASWGLLGASWGALEAILAQKGYPPDPFRTSPRRKPGYHGTGSALEARAASTASGEQQSRKASRKHSLQASRARSAPPLSVLSWGFAWNASRAGGRNGSLQTKKHLSNMAPKCHPGGCKNAPKSLQGGSQGAPGERKRKW